MSEEQSSVPEALSDPGVWLVFTAAGVLVGTLTAWRLSLPIPAASFAFPARGELLFTAQFLPGPGPVVGTPPGAIAGLEPQFLLAIALRTVLAQCVLAVATASACQRVLRGEWRPPLVATAWLALYAVGIALGGFGALWLWGGALVTTPAVLLAVIPAAIVLYLTPAVVVAEKVNPVRAAVRALALFVRLPFRTAFAALVVGYLGYLLTGVAGVVGTDTAVGFAVATGVSTAVAGAVGVAVVAAYYERAAARPPLGERSVETPASRADD